MLLLNLPFATNKKHEQDHWFYFCVDLLCCAKSPYPKPPNACASAWPASWGSGVVWLRSGLPQQTVPWYLGEYAEPPGEWERGGQVIAELFQLSRWHIAFSPWGQSSLVMKMRCSLVHHWWASDKKQVVIPVARSWAVLAGYGAELINAHTVSWMAALQPGTYGQLGGWKWFESSWLLPVSLTRCLVTLCFGNGAATLPQTRDGNMQRKLIAGNVSWSHLLLFFCSVTPSWSCNNREEKFSCSDITP